MKAKTAAKNIRIKQKKFDITPQIRHILAPTLELGNALLVDSKHFDEIFAEFCAQYRTIDYHRIHAILTCLTLFDCDYKIDSVDFNATVPQSNLIDFIAYRYKVVYPDIDEAVILGFLHHVTVAQACDGLIENPFSEWWTKYFPQAAAAKYIDINNLKVSWADEYSAEYIAQLSPLKKAWVDALPANDRDYYLGWNLRKDNLLFFWKDLLNTPVGWAVLRAVGYPKISEKEFEDGVREVYRVDHVRHDNTRFECHPDLLRSNLRSDRVYAYVITHTIEDIKNFRLYSAPSMSLIGPYPFDNYDRHTASLDSDIRHYRKIVSILSDNNRKFMESDEFLAFINDDNDDIRNCPYIKAHDKAKMIAKNEKLPDHTITACQVKAIPSHTKVKTESGHKVAAETGRNGFINLRTIIDEDGGYVRAYWDAQTCHNVLMCAECNRKFMFGKRDEIVSGLENLKKKMTNLQFVFATFTFPHKGQFSLSVYMELLRLAQGMLRSGDWYHNFRKTYGMIGDIRALEATFSLYNWWHPHFHYIWLFDKEDEFSKDEIKRITDSIIDRWIHCCIAKGLVADTAENRENMLAHSVDLKFSAKDVRLWSYLAKDDPLRQACCHDYVILEKAANELTNPARTKESKLSGHISQFDVLRRATDMSLKISDDERKLYRKAWAQFVCGMNGRSAIQWSPGLKKLCGIEEEPKEEGDILGVFDEYNKKALHYHRLQTSALMNIESHGGQFSDAFRNLLEKKGIKYFRNEYEFENYYNLLEYDKHAAQKMPSSICTDDKVVKEFDIPEDVTDYDVIELEAEEFEGFLGKVDIENHVKYIGVFVDYFREHQSEYQGEEYLNALDLLLQRYSEYSQEADYYSWKNVLRDTHSDKRYDALEAEISTTYRQCMQRWTREIDHCMCDDIESADYASVMSYAESYRQTIDLSKKLEKRQRTVIEYQQLELKM